MCIEPGSATAIAIGITQAVAQAGMSIANFVSQTQAARASERAYQQQRNLNAEAANRAYQQEQIKLKGEFDVASQKAEQLLVNRLQTQGTTLAAGRSGQSISGLLADAQRVEGKDLGSLGMNLAYAQQNYAFGAENIFQQHKAANITAANQRTAAPSVGGLILELGGAALSGVMAGLPLKAPPAGVGTGSFDKGFTLATQYGTTNWPAMPPLPALP
jgi:hypothetical protein